MKLLLDQNIFFRIAKKSRTFILDPGKLETWDLKILKILLSMYRPGCPGPVLSINLITGGKFAFPVKPVPLHT
jgi:hypothetical protein